MYDRGGDVVGYELLFRGASVDLSASRRNAYATSQVIVNAFTEFGLPELVGDHTCFINLTREFIVGELEVPFEPDQVVLEILETVDVDDEVVAGVTRLAERGYAIALDDFVFGLGRERLLTLASYVKLDFLAHDAESIAAAVAACREYPGVRLVAERVETPEQSDLARRLGFDLFQGYALGRTQVVSIATLAPSRLRRLELLGALTGPECDLDHVVSIVTSDPALSFRILRATNAVAEGTVRRISSVREAVVMLGSTRIRQWVTLMLVSDIAEATEEQLSATMARARLCQTVGIRLGVPADPAFTVGLLWGVADVLGVPMTELVSRLPLTQEIADALIAERGRLGEVLGIVRGYERDDGSSAENSGMSPTDLAQAYLASVGWSVRTMHGVLGARSPRRLPPP